MYCMEFYYIIDGTKIFALFSFIKYTSQIDALTTNFFWYYHRPAVNLLKRDVLLRPTYFTW